MYPEFTVQDYLLYMATLKNIQPALAKRRTEEMLQMTGMSEYRKLKMKALSGGMKRRAGIAQAVLNDPKILILDEPTAGLDPSERIRFRNLISELSADRIVAVIDAGFLSRQADGRSAAAGCSSKAGNLLCRLNVGHQRIVVGSKIGNRCRTGIVEDISSRSALVGGVEGEGAGISQTAHNLIN